MAASRATCTRVLVVAAAVALGGVLLVPGTAARSTKCVVTDTGSHRKFAALQAAVDAAVTGATLRLKGVCIGTTTIERDVTIEGRSTPGLGPATLDGNGAGTVVTVAGGVVSIDDIVITGGSAMRGGGLATPYAVHPARDITLTRSVITGNTAEDGGGISITFGRLTLIDTTISGNTAIDDGGGYYGEPSADLTTQGSTTFTGNRAGDSGGGVWLSMGYVSIGGQTSIDHNVAARGGGLAIADSEVTLTGSASIHDNSAVEGGGVSNAGMPGVLRLDDASSIRGNTATYGGGVFGSISLTILRGTSSISGNSASADGGGVYLAFPYSTLEVLDSGTITANTAGSAGGGVYGGAVTVAGPGSITGNQPDDCYPPGSVTDCPE